MGRASFASKISTGASLDWTPATIPLVLTGGKCQCCSGANGFRKTTSFKPACTIPEPLLAWLESSVNPDGDKRGLILAVASRAALRVWELGIKFRRGKLAKLIHRPVIWFWGHEQQAGDL